MREVSSDAICTQFHLDTQRGDNDESSDGRAFTLTGHAEEDVLNDFDEFIDFLIEFFLNTEKFIFLKLFFDLEAPDAERAGAIGEQSIDTR